jgi:hypothetical protein
MSTLRLIVEASIQEARNLMEPDFSMRSSSLNMPVQTSQNQMKQMRPDHDPFRDTFDSIPSIPHRASSLMKGEDYISQEFEDIGHYEEQKSTSVINQEIQPSKSSAHSIAIGGESPVNHPHTEASTDVNNLVNH